MVKTLGFHCRAHGLVPGQETEDLACGMVQREKKIAQRNNMLGVPTSLSFFAPILPRRFRSEICLHEPSTGFCVLVASGSLFFFNHLYFFFFK